VPEESIENKINNYENNNQNQEEENK